MQYRFFTADVFTDRAFGGNQLAVLPEAQGLDDRRMQQVAREFNFPETVFVFPPEDARHTRKLRIFTPGHEVPFAGHPTVGTAHVLSSAGQIPLNGALTRIVFEEKVGPVPVSIRAEGGQPVFCQLTAAQPPEFGPPPPDAAAIAAAISLQPSDVRQDEYAPRMVSAGLPFLCVPLKDRQAVARARLNLDAWEKEISQNWAPYVFFFAFDPELEGSDIRARMFAPSAGIPEDPATGSAAAALGGYLGVRAGGSDETLRWRIEQGFEMGRPSLIDIEVEKKNGQIEAIRVGGPSVLVTQGSIEIP
ncbi:MAG: PhzF family phenazine biosynthesis protein [Acidobacteriota bacterium]